MTEKKIEQAVRSTGNTAKAAAIDIKTAHRGLPAPANVEHLDDNFTFMCAHVWER